MIALVTGCRSGFGLRIAETLGRAGHTVYAGLRDLDTAGPLRAATAGLLVHPVQLDVTDPAQREQVVADIEARHGAVDVLVNNAGITRIGPVETFEEAELRAVLEVNLVAVWALTQRVLPAMRARRSGTVIHISSMSGRWALPTMGVYAASKHALNGLAEAMRFELSPLGVRVVLVEPGPYATDILGRNLNRSAGAADPSSPYRALLDRMEELAGGASDGAGDPQEVADRVLSLAEHPDPPLWNPIGPRVRARRLIRWALPARVYERVVERFVYGARRR